MKKLLDTLSSTERTAFRKWLASPFHNQRADLVLLFNLYEQCLRKRRELPDKSEIHQMLYPELAFDDHRVRLAMSLMLGQVERFLVFQQQQQDTVQHDIELLRVYRNRNLTDTFAKYLDAAKEHHQRQPLRHPDWHWQAFELERETHFLQTNNQRTTKPNVQDTNDALDRSYMALKLRHVCAALAYQTVYNKQYEMGLLGAVLAAITPQEIEEWPALAVYYACYQALVQPSNTELFQHFKGVLYRYTHVFPPAEQRDLYLLAINYCIQRYNSGDRNYLQEEMELYQRGLADRALFINGRLSRFTYRNVVTLGITLSRLDETEAFIADYHQHLEAQHRDANFAFGMARVAFERGQYGQVLSLLQQSDYSDLLLNLAAKALLLKVYFDTQAFDALYSHLDAMSNFVRRKKEIGYHRDHYLQLCKYTKKILALRVDDHIGREQLQHAIRATDKLAYKDWLLTKVDLVR